MVHAGDLKFSRPRYYKDLIYLSLLNRYYYTNLFYSTQLSNDDGNVDVHFDDDDFDSVDADDDNDDDDDDDDDEEATCCESSLLNGSIVETWNITSCSS